MSLHRAGGKFTKSHTTLIDAAIPIVDRASDMPEVTKISLGEIRTIGKGLRGVKFHPINGGWRLVVRGNTTIQDIYIYTGSPEKTKWELSKLG